MRKCVIVSTLLLAGLAAGAGSAAALDLSNEYRMAVADYYGVSYDLVADLVELGITDEELAVNLHVADRAEADAIEVAKTRLAGKSWSAVTKEMGLGADIFYMIVASKVKSRSYAPIFQRFSATSQQKWAEIAFSDKEIIDLANLRFVSSHYDYSVFEVMAMRDYGKTFMRINHQVKEVKEAQYRKNRAQSDK
jgi:hypothetical protein